MSSIKRGSTGTAVRAWKDTLIKMGFTQTPGDLFDLATEAATRHYQQANHLTEDGVVGPRTLASATTATPLAAPNTINPVPIFHNTPYFSQRDNTYVPSGTCNVTSLAMVLAFLGEPIATGTQLEDSLFQELDSTEGRAEFARSYPELKAQGFNARNVHGMLGWLARRHNYDWSYTESCTFASFKTALTAAPVITSGTFTAGGHIIVVVGLTSNDNFICHDPWGDWDAGYAVRKVGQNVIYDREAMWLVLKGASPTKKRIHIIRKKS